MATTFIATFEVDAVSMEATHISLVGGALIDILADCLCKGVTLGAEALVSPLRVNALAEATGMGIGQALVRVDAYPVDLVVTWEAYAGVVWLLIDTVPINTWVVSAALVDVDAGLVGRAHFISEVTLTFKGAHQVNTATAVATHGLVGLVVAFVDVVTCAVGQPKARMALAQVGSWQVDTIPMTAECRYLVALVYIEARTIDLMLPESHMALALVSPRSVYAQLTTGPVLLVTLVHIPTGFPVGGQTEPLGAEAEDLTVAVNALV